MKRVRFCGVIEGSVAVREGESEDDAILRAEVALNDTLARVARRYHRDGDTNSPGPVVGLEPAP